jgi:hypothetical protein
MLLWILLSASVILLGTNWAILERLEKHRINVPIEEWILDGKNGLRSIELWRPFRYTEAGKRLVRWWLVTAVGWALVALSLLYALRGA